MEIGAVTISASKTELPQGPLSDQALSKLVGKRIGTVLTRCKLSIYPTRVIADLITESNEDVTFTRFEDTYRSQHIGRTKFRISLSQQRLMETQGILTRIRKSSLGNAL